MKEEKQFFFFITYSTSISVVNMFINNPVMVSRFGANQRGTFETKKHHQGCKIGSRILTFVQEYLCSDNFFNCTPDNNLFLYRNIFRICDIFVIYILRHYGYHLTIFQFFFTSNIKCPQTILLNIFGSHVEKESLRTTQFIQRSVTVEMWCDFMMTEKKPLLYA